MEMSMAIKFIPHEGPTDEVLIEVHLGPILHGYIIRAAPEKFHYFRIINQKAVRRHEADSMENLKQMVLEIP